MQIIMTVFRHTLISSLMAVLLVGIILLVKLLFKNSFDAKWHHYIWFLLIARLVIPYAPQSSLSIFNIVTPVVQKLEIKDFSLQSSNSITTDNELFGISGQENKKKGTDNDSLANNTLVQTEVKESSDTSPAVSERNNDHYSINIKLFIIWVAGCTLMTCYTAYTNIRFRKSISRFSVYNNERVNKILNECKEKTNIKKMIPVLVTMKSGTPFLCGIIKPKIYICQKYIHILNDDDLKYILLHELSHYKRNDVFINCVIMILQIIYWFNPVIWYAFYRMRQDCEIACDAKALSYIDGGERKKYGQTIINLLKEVTESCFVSSTAGLMKNNSGVKRRIFMISNFKNRSRMRAAAAIILSILVGLVGLSGTKTLAAQDEKISFKDKKLEELITAELGKPKGSTLYKLEIQNIKRLTLNEVSSLDEIKYCTNLETLALSSPKDLKGVESLKNLKKLREIMISNLNGYSNLNELGDLKQLESLFIVKCSDLSSINVVLQLPNIKELRIYGRSKLTNKSMSVLPKLGNLTVLFVEYIPITDLKILKNLTKLENLAVSWSQVKDISPLKNLTKLKHLNLIEAKIKDISPISGMKNLEYVELTGNLIEDITPLSNKKALETIYLGKNNISNIDALSGLLNVKTLSINKNKVTDIKSLAGLKNLESLNLSNNQIIDVTSLSGLIKMFRLDLTNNKITDVKPLAGLTKIKGGLFLRGNNVKDYSPIAEIYNPEDEK